MPTHFRSLWISDTHFGGKNIQSERLFDFLKNTSSDYLYLVGDIFDFHCFARKWYWPEINNRIVDLILERAGNGTQVYYIPGNHDAMLRNYVGTSFNNIRIRSQVIHVGADGGKYLVLHGDVFDCVIQKSPWLARFGGFLYERLLVLNRWYNALRKMCGKQYFSISAYLKHKCKKAVNYIGDFEESLIDAIKENKVDGIVCGHIHHASIKMMGASLYSNSGDWVESCTALAESESGTFGIVDWSESVPLTEPVDGRIYEKDSYRDRCLAPTN